MSFAPTTWPPPPLPVTSVWARAASKVTTHMRDEAMFKSNGLAITCSSETDNPHCLCRRNRILLPEAPQCKAHASRTNHAAFSQSMPHAQVPTRLRIIAAGEVELQLPQRRGLWELRLERDDLSKEGATHGSSVPSPSSRSEGSWAPGLHEDAILGHQAALPYRAEQQNSVHAMILCFG